MHHVLPGILCLVVFFYDICTNKLKSHKKEVIKKILVKFCFVKISFTLIVTIQVQ